MSVEEQIEYISRLKSGSEQLRFAMLDAWNNNAEILIKLSIYLKKQNVEKPVDILYGTNEFNKKVGKKSECKAIAALIDEQMLALGFVRTMLQPIPNLDDATIYRMVGRYSAIISKDEVIYRR
jgi:hypothetical protein